VYASSGLFSSLGALLVNVVLLFVFVFTLSKQVAAPNPNKTELSSVAKSALFFIPAFFVLIVFTGFIISVIRSLVLDSNIPFDISNIFNFTWFSFIGLLITALLVSIHFFASNMVYLLMQRFGLQGILFFVFGIVAVGLYAGFQQLNNSLNIPLLIQAPAYAFALIIVLQLCKTLKPAQKTLAYVLVVSVFVAMLFYRFNIDKEHEIRKHYALQLSDAKDIEAENIFTDIEHQIATDPRIFNYFTNAIFSKRDLEKHIKQLYFTGYLGKYEVEIFDYDTLGNFFRENNYYTHEFVDNLYNNFSQATLSNYFYYIVYPSVQYNYIAKYDYCVGTRTMGSLYILLRRKLIQDQSLFTQLLSQNSSANIAPPYNYSYAIYQNNKLVNKGGKYSYTLDFSLDTSQNTEYLVYDNYTHLIKNEPNNILVVVSKRVDGILQPLAVFSFLFLMLLLFIALLFVYNGLIMLLRAGLSYYTGKWKPLYRFNRFAQWLVPIRRMKGLLFSTRIQITIFTLVSAILLLSGYLFLRYIDYKYTERQRDKMVQKIKSVVSSFENEAQFEIQLMLPAELTGYLNQIGDFYETDIHFYDAEGQLVTSTKNKIFSSGLISKQINAEAYEKLNVESQSFYIHDEKIGSLKYISAYVPVLDTKHNVIAYLNLPFFTNEAELSDEISAFFVNFVNLYILFFLVAAVIAYIITQRVTAPLTLIQNKLSKLSLSSKNEIIEWKDEDEIGELVAQYNKMIIALEESANRLAEGEREGAWREMAKQIAHEIKNPLTPMKLSVQHLQRAWAAKGENIDEIFKRVTSVLIEQIDSLSNLASEFSSFAKMPEPVAEKLELNDLLRLTAALYENTQNIHVAFEPYTTTAFVMADKDQLSRVFKNLITNAIQAIPDETEGVIEIKILKTETYYKVEVSDNGKGIPDEQGNKVFIPSFSTKTSGMGLGLAISKKIVESVGGKIYFVSQVNVGTTFVVELPVVVGD
jgi:two-component system, NtrC family, nitrogen regulation sensor histidine kinase NtrY